MPPLTRSLSALHWPAAARRWLRYCALLLALGAAAASLLLGPMAAASSPGALGANPETATPLAVAQGAPPLVMLTMARDHTLFYEAYNDASDINGDGRLDIRFDPRIIYLGLFDSRLCYAYTPGTTDADARRNDNAGIFRPAARAVAAPGTNTNLSCATANHWSGNWLNWATTSRIDALRVVLYGGYRETDTATSTVLRRAYIPQDAHSWAKEYTSVTVDRYDISAFTPLDLPTGTGTRRHFFGNLTDVRNFNCAALSDCSNRAPLLRVVTNAENARVWQWATTERPVLHESNNQFGGTRTDRTVRVEVCTAAFNDGCKRYPGANAASTTDDVFKPVGLLHEFGENGAMLFGLLTGSYDRNLSGGVLRKVVSSFATEVNPTDGTFTADATIVNTINALRIRGFNDGRTDDAYRGGWVTTRPMNQGEFVDWGNPVAEMMYEGLRYFDGRGGATSAFATSGGVDGHLGLLAATWDDPFDTQNSAARARWCARPNQLVISGVNPSFDSDQLPGSAFGGISGDLSGNHVGTRASSSLHVANIGDTIATHEPGIRGMRFIGQVGTTFDGAPTAKYVSSLGNIRGLSPEGPTQQGSFYSASVAHFGRITDLRTTLQGQQTVDTHVVALSSPLPTIAVAAPGGRTFSLVPFAKSVGGSGIDNAKGAFQPTNQIVDFYVDTIANSCPAAGGGVASMCTDSDSAVNGGRYFARFRINFEDVEQGADHDMDAVILYEIWMQADGRLRVLLTPEYEAGGIQHSFGYVLSGSTADGVYLVVQDQNVTRHYHLNVPPGQLPGFCDATPSPTSPCNTLPHLGGGAGNNSSERFFSASPTPAASVLPSPLWLAAKWGGFTDLNNNQRPDLQAEWDVNRDGVPDTYHLVQNPTLLRDQLARAFNTILERGAAAGNVSANSTFITTDSAVFQATFNSANWSGDLLSFPVTAAGGVGAVPLWRASERLPAFASRRLFTTNAAASPATVPFAWSGLSTAQRNLFGANNSIRQGVINHLRGDPSREVRNGGTLRNRPTTVLGDIIHSSPVYVGDNNTVFVGSNSGFLHAFNASTGDERFAFAPSSLLAHMPRLSDPNYVRRYFVDGELAVSQRANTGNRNILVGFLGRGGRGLFALDVTNPDSFGDSANRALWEAYGASDDDMGYLLGRPMIAKVRGDRTGATPIDVVIFGNGYNSPDGRAVLYVKNLHTGALISKIDTGVGSATNPNGLASPGLALDANGVVEHVYAGDLEGNVWKFDLTSHTPADWRSSFVSGTTPVPFFVATNAAGVRQPITAPITVATNNVAGDPHVGKRFVFFGTGSYMRATDPADRQVQSFYGLIDEGVQITGRTALRQRSINQIGTFAGRPVRTFSVASAGDMAGRQGWFLDWVEPPSGTARGERVVSAARIIPTVEPALVISSIIPVADDPCVPGGTGFLNLLNPFSGGSITVGLLDVNRDGSFADDRLGTQFIGSFDPGIGLLSESVLVGDRLVVGGSEAEIADVRVLRPLAPGLRGRISWREIIR